MPGKSWTCTITPIMSWRRPAPAPRWCGFSIPNSFADDPALLRKSQDLQKRFFEFSEFLVKVLKVEDLGARFAHRVTYHDSCHLLRELGVGEAPRQLLRKVQGIDLVEMNDYKLCCGFGGTFSVKFPEVSVPMGQDKIRAATRDRRRISGGR